MTKEPWTCEIEVELDGVRDRVDGETERVFEVDKGLGLEEGKGVEGGWEETDMRAKRLEGVDGFDAQTELEGDARREVLEGSNESEWGTQRL